MRLLRRLSTGNQDQKPCVLTIGNFDGVHVGHQALLMNLRFAAATYQLPAAVLTFNPHPREFFQPANAPTRITTLRDKLAALRVLGVNDLYVAHFNHSFSKLEPDEFIDEILIKRIKPRKIIVGDDFCFGAKRAGSFATLRHAGEKHGFLVEAMPTIKINGDRASSTRVRLALEQGDMAETARLLNRPYRISGHIVHGQKLGRTLGFPTINLAFHPGKPAIDGIFVVKVYGLQDKPVAGVASIGHRPSVEENGAVWLEVHLFDFSQEVYGKLVSVEFIQKIRNIEKFTDIRELTQAIDLDAQIAKSTFQQYPWLLSL